MNFNDSKFSQLTFFPQAYHTNMTASFKYLKREQSPTRNTMQPSHCSKIFNNQNSSAMQLTRNSDKKYTQSQQGSCIKRKGSIIAKQQQEIKVPPLKSLNNEDKEKLIGTLLQQIKHSNNQIQQMEIQIAEQNKKLDTVHQAQQNIVIKEEQLIEKQQLQQQINQRIYQINEFHQPTNQPPQDCLQIINDIYEAQIDQEMAIQWREARLKFKFIDSLSKAVKQEKKVQQKLKIIHKLQLKQCLRGWKLQIQKKQMLQQFQLVISLRSQISHWIQWKNYITDAKKFKINSQKAKAFHHNKLQKKGLYGLLIYHRQNNYALKDFRVITQQVDKVMNKSRKLTIFKAWVKQIQRQLYQNYVVTEQNNKMKNQQRKSIIIYLQNNAQQQKQNNQQLILEMQHKRIRTIWFYIKNKCHHNRLCEQKIKQNKLFFIKRSYLKFWNNQLSANRKYTNLQNKAIHSYHIRLLQKSLLMLKFNTINHHKDRKNYNQIRLQHQLKLRQFSFLNWFSVYTSKKTEIITEQTMLIRQQELIVQEQQNDTLQLETQYNNAKFQIKEYQDQLSNLKKICDESALTEQQLIIQNEYLKQELSFSENKVAQLMLDSDELKIVEEQLRVSKQKNKELTLQLTEYQHQRPNRHSLEQETVKKQLDMSNKLIGEQKSQNENLKQDYSYLMNECEQKIKEIERYYVDLCDKQKLQIERLLKENATLRNDSNVNYHSRTKLLEELNIIHGSYEEPLGEQRRYPYLDEKRGKYSSFSHNNTSPYSDRNPQYSPPSKLLISQEERKIKQEAQSLRDDIKRRLATLKTQMDNQTQ